MDDGGVVRVVDDSLPASKHLRFEDVVLPLPGHGVLYPTHQIGDLYRSFLESEGVSFRKDSPPESTAKGGYRKLVARVYNFTVEPRPAAGANGDDYQLDVTLKFDLPTGSYATMLLRELMLTTVARNTRDA
jgi:tRNA pseudouridine13 synthase